MRRIIITLIAEKKRIPVTGGESYRITAYVPVPLRIRLLYLFGVCRLRATAIIIDEKNGLTVMSTLGSVMGYFGDDNASGPRHEEQCTIMGRVSR
jgi:hypothetical protein